MTVTFNLKFHLLVAGRVVPLQVVPECLSCRVSGHQSDAELGVADTQAITECASLAQPVAEMKTVQVVRTVYKRVLPLHQPASLTH